MSGLIRPKIELDRAFKPVFPIISQWKLSVAMETRVLIQSALKLYAAFPLPQ